MPAVCFYFQIHQPFRLRKYTVFDSEPRYFDDAMNARLVQRIAERCYVPMNRLLLEMIRVHGGRFRVAFSITGTALEQLEMHAPEVVQGLHALAQTRCVEFLGETFYHSLASLEGAQSNAAPHEAAAASAGSPENPGHSSPEFREQVELHRRMIRRLFGQTPTVFRNTELIYSNRIAGLARELGFNGVLAEGWEPVLNNRSTAFIYRAAVSREFANLSTPPPLLLLRNHRLSDAIAYRFTDSRSPDFPLTDVKFAHLVSQIGGRLCNLFMDYETFGEHTKAETGIFDFFAALPQKLLAAGCQFALPSELLAAPEAALAGELDVPSPISWADESRDLGAWLGNAMQKNAADELYKLEEPVKQHADPRLLSDWRKLTTSDHFYYMATKENADAAVHNYFRPYDSPYDAYINFMNVLDNVRARAG